MNDTIIASLPEIREVDERIADVDKREAVYKQNTREARATDEHAYAQWEQKRDTAITAGKLPPKPPQRTAPNPGEGEQRFHVERQQLQAERRRAIARNADEIRQLAAEQIADAQADAGPLLAQLDQIAARIAAARRAVSEAETCRDWQRHGAPQNRHSPAFDTNDLVQHRGKSDLLADLGESRKLGMTRWSEEVRYPPEPSPAQLQQTAANLRHQQGR